MSSPRLIILLFIIVFIFTACGSKEVADVAMQGSGDVGGEDVVINEDEYEDENFAASTELEWGGDSSTDSADSSQVGSGLSDEAGVLDFSLVDKRESVDKQEQQAQQDEPGDEEREVELPETFDQEVAFAPQAPFAVWDELHKEACEEAAIIIAAKHLKGEQLDKETMEKEIIELVEWEKENLGKWKDTTAEETAEIIKDYFGLSAELLYDPRADDIKREVAQGNLVVAPTAGRMLDNPYFTGQGPLYHMLVVRGYDQTHFITNDPGTKRGEGFRYTYINLLGAIHDWNDGDVRKGERVVIVVSK